MRPGRTAQHLLAVVLASGGAVAAAAEGVPVDLSGYRPDCGVLVRDDGGGLTLTWRIDSSPDEGQGTRLRLDLRPGHPLIAELNPTAGDPPPDRRGAFLDHGADFATFVTVGTRVGEAGRPPGMSPFNAFFDAPARRPHRTYKASLDRKWARVTSQGRRATVTLGDVTAGPFSGTLQLTFSAKSPLIHVETVLTTQQPDCAYLYDAGLVSDRPDWETLGWTDTEGRWQVESQGPALADRALAVRYRMVAAENPRGAIACFPPPHKFFFARDLTDNLRNGWAGRDHRGLEARAGFGLRQPEAGGGRYAPWYNAPTGTEQRLGVFYLVSRGTAEQAAMEALKYTRGDRFPEVPGHRTFTSHWHLAAAEAAMKEQAEGGTRTTPEFVKMFRDMGVNLVHLAEFHGDGHPQDPGPLRLPEMAAMFAECKRLSAPDLLFLPGEEANVHLRTTRPGGNPGHWLYLFPRPVNWTMTRGPGQPFAETLEPFGQVYHVGDQGDMVRLLIEEHGLAWTAHPRIKASTWAPDAYKDAEFYRSDRWLGAAWKGMPVDLSRERLGERGLDLLDDMNNWGEPKALVGEVDVFKLDHTHELYGHMNINYLKLDRQPGFDEDWSPVLDALRNRRFFTTTGEVLIRDLAIESKSVRVELDWTFPLKALYVISGDGEHVTRERIDLSDTEGFGRRTWTLTPDLKGRRWARVEAWDIAGNGAFSQPTRLD